MNTFSDMIWIEYRKATRSVMPLSTALGFLMVPLAITFLMLIYKDPEFARSSGILTAKAELMGGTADWPTFLSMLAQAIAIGGIILFSLVGSWVFGREFVDGTMKDLMAVPVSRGSIVAAKFVVIAIWSLGLIFETYLISLAAGFLIGLPLGTPQVLLDGSLTVALTSILVVIVVMPIAFFASIGRGYLLPIGLAILAIMSGNIIALIGWGHIYPWSIPVLFADVAKRGTDLIPASYLVVALTGLVGLVSTYFWWKRADQHR